MNQTQVAARERNYGIDLLRIVSMLMVVTLHVMGHGGVLKGAVKLSVNYEVAWALEILCLCAVNCYALISGYVGIESRFKLSNICLIWLQVVFYSVSLSVLCAWLSPDIYLNSVFKAFMPVRNDIYWYFTAYFFVCFFAPLINAAINNLSVKQLKLIGILLFILVSVLPFSAKTDVFFLKNGYSALWMLIMYVLGGIIKKTGLISNLKWYTLALIYLLACLITWIEKFIVDYVNVNAAGKTVLKNRLESYTSVTIVLAAVALLVLFSKIKVGKASTKVISFFSALTFGVYLIHEMPLIRAMFIKGRFASFATQNVWLMIGLVVLAIVSIYLLCSVIEYLRSWLFKMLHIKQVLQLAEEKTIGKWLK